MEKVAQQNLEHYRNLMCPGAVNLEQRFPLPTPRWIHQPKPTTSGLGIGAGLVGTICSNAPWIPISGGIFALISLSNYIDPLDLCHPIQFQRTRMATRRCKICTAQLAAEVIYIAMCLEEVWYGTSEDFIPPGLPRVLWKALVSAGSLTYVFLTIWCRDAPYHCTLSQQEPTRWRGHKWRQQWEDYNPFKRARELTSRIANWWDGNGFEDRPRPESQAATWPRKNR